MVCLQNSKYLTFLKQLEWGQASISENEIMVADPLNVSHLKK